MSVFQSQNPGIGGLDELTDSETLFLQNLVTLQYEDGDILYYSGGSLQVLNIGVDNKILKVVSGLPSWEDETGGGGGGSGTVTTISVVTANGVSGSVANATTTPAITLTLGAITPTSVNGITLIGASSPQLTVTGTSSISGANTGDQTSVTGNAGTATALQNTRTIWGQNFNGTANVVGTLALGSSDLTMTGSIGATGARVTKVWATDLEVTNAIVGSVTGNAATATALQTTRNINGVSFNGTGDITVTAAAGTLTGTTLNATVVT